jgi:3'(2'), 5'-bisphosphate nucleotidase
MGLTDYRSDLVADYAAQAVVNTILGAAFPQDGIVGEEDAHDLTREENDMTLKKVVELANQVLQNPRTTSDADLDQWGVGTIYPENQLINAINRGDDEGGSNKRMVIRFIPWCQLIESMGRVGFWTLDPIDGTKGFRRGEQYAVCLALIENSIVKLGVIGCPNLPVDASKPDGEKGCLFVAVREQGAYQVYAIIHHTFGLANASFHALEAIFEGNRTYRVGRTNNT